MADLEQRARELLAAGWKRAGQRVIATLVLNGHSDESTRVAISAISDALRQQPAAVVDDAARLLAICQNAHDRLLRGDDDSELLAILEQAWSAHEAVESP